MPKRPSLQSRLFAAALTCMIPIWLGYACIAYYLFNTKYAELTSRTQDLAQAVRQAAELKLVGVEASLGALATSPALENKDFKAFHRQAATLAEEFEGADIILAEESGQQLVNSYLAFGSALPKRKNASMLKALFENGRPHISGPFKGAVTGRHLIGMDIPVWHGTGVAYDLGMTFPAYRFVKMMEDLKLPPGWIGSIVSAEGLVIARTSDMDRFVGQPLSVGVDLEWLFKHDEITLDINALDGTPLTTSFCRSERFGWMVAVSMPRSELSDVVRKWVLYALVFSGAVGLLAMALAYILSRRIAWEFTSLAGLADRMRLGERGAIEKLGLAESYRLGRALEASFQCAQDEAVLRKEAQDDLREHLRMLEDVVASRTAELSKANRELEQEIAQRVQAEQELAKANRYISNIIDSMPSLLVCVDKEMRLTRINANAASSAGIVGEDALGRPLQDLFPELDVSPEMISRVIYQRQPELPVRQEMDREGDNRFLDIMVYPLVSNCVDGAVVRVDDVTDRVRLESIKRQADKMMLMGSLAAGVAHEINNPLSIVTQSVQLAALRLQPGVAANERAAEAAGLDMKALDAYLTQRGVLAMFQDVREAISRAASIVRTMLAFARGGETRLETHALGNLARQAVEHVRSEFGLDLTGTGRPINIRVESPADEPDAPCAGQQIDQVFTNLLRNAVSVLMDQPDDNREPEVVVRTWHDAEHVYAAFSDNGPGIPGGVTERIFEPFFSTKSPGAGTGLGLSISFFIVTNIHKGKLTVSSVPGEGTTFTVAIPRRRHGAPTPE
ncbi:Sporulation kinase E [Fundidesulfovibrio magnetotacticus]|uniref:histidine kinase n=1 Tax=Fundidesulfovibrio magnetotacticus TaxID=2730080 RepID=A0A6V8M1E3_9BACT|nr:ATP-binding protein [Fundidesulfovibrio magnetotacticus]GFK96039.1 Sporulation kinase E [Fundidesulfovibrio magnetotacticus]